MAGYTIKPLEWVEHSEGHCSARTPIGEWNAGDGWFNSTWCGIEAPVDGGLDASKRAAEADYEARIRSALIDNPIVEQLAEALEPFAGIGEEMANDISYKTRPDEGVAWYGYNNRWVTYGCFRRARAVLAAYKATQGEAS